ncbi:MAG: hypothetical protein KJ646_04085 [Nanoarchaeota archaeon]|nr:hypothetical protein [Nanoarchaeota archaeon]MBU4116954.1 hypothetical protein [Nanoarchaeota archaeon]
MGIKSQENSFGAWAFLIGVLLAIIIALIKSFSIDAFVKFNQLFYILLVAMGITIGSINVRTKDINTFLLAGTVLVIVSKFGLEGVIDRLGGSLLGITKIGIIGQEVFGALLVLFIPAVIIVALKSVFSITKI